MPNMFTIDLTYQVSTMSHMNDDKHHQAITLVYDKQCPACERYCQLVRIRESVGELKLLDARDGGELVDRITARGWDIDQGMVLQLDQQLYYAADAIHMLSLLSSRNGLFNHFNYWAFKSPLLAKALYPVLKFGRNLLLKFLGRTKINNLDLPDNERF